MTSEEGREKEGMGDRGDGRVKRSMNGKKKMERRVKEMLERGEGSKGRKNAGGN